jgi:thiosulfate dehydrogenase
MTCANCHLNAGQRERSLPIVAVAAMFPEYNRRSGVYTLAGIIRYAMPYLNPGSLTDEEAQNVAAFVNGKPRPEFPFKPTDYATEKLPADAVYYPRR